MENDIRQLRTELTPWLLLLQKYYQGHLCKLGNSKWNEIIGALEESISPEWPGIEESYLLIRDAGCDRQADMQYDFNRLFIGPDVLQAPPYESCYRNPDKTLMQAETLKVREKYLRAGLAISRKNVEPDDFIGFELEFLLFLLSDESGEMTELTNQFLTEHLLVWYKDHVEAIRENTKHPICLGMAGILEAVMMKLETILSNKPQS